MGEVFRNPLLARTLERIAEGGRDAFYRGDMAVTMADYLRRQGGWLDETDLAAHTVAWVEPWLSFGVMGGDMQPQGQVQVLMSLIDFGMGLQEAGDAPRIYHTGSSEPTGEPMAAGGGTVHLEPGFPEESVRDLVRMGHRIGRTTPGSFGGYQAIRVEVTNRVYFGASESRKDGQAGGY